SPEVADELAPAGAGEADRALEPGVVQELSGLVGRLDDEAYAIAGSRLLGRDRAVVLDRRHGPFGGGGVEELEVFDGDLDMGRRRGLGGSRPIRCPGGGRGAGYSAAGRGFGVARGGGLGGAALAAGRGEEREGRDERIS